MASSKNYLEKGSQKAMPLISDSRDKKNQCKDHNRKVLKEKPSFPHSLAAPQVHLSLTHVYVHSLFHPLAHSFIQQFPSFSHSHAFSQYQGPTMHQVSCLVLRTQRTELAPYLGDMIMKVGDGEMCISFPLVRGCM